MHSSAEKAILPGLFAISMITMLERLALFLCLSVLLAYLQVEQTLSMTEADQVQSTFFVLLIFSPLCFGLLADFTNRRAVIASGLVALVLGYIFLSLLPADYNYKGYFPLVLIALGYGAFRPNIPVVLGKIFDNNHLHSKGYIGFIVYYIFINMGALPAPAIAQFLNHSMGYEAVFLTSACLVLIAHVVFLVTRKFQMHLHLKTDEHEHRSKDHVFNKVVLVVVLLFIIPINVALYQPGTTVLYFIRDYLGDYIQLGSTVPGIKLLMVISCSVVLAIVCYMFFKYSRFLLLKILSIGLMIAALGYAVLVLSLQLYETSQSLNALYIAVVLMAMGETLFVPLVMYIVYRTSPRQLKGLFMAILVVCGSVASQLMVMYSGVYEKQGALITFTIISCVLLGFGFFFFMLQMVLKYMHSKALFCQIIQEISRAILKRKVK